MTSDWPELEIYLLIHLVNFPIDEHLSDMFTALGSISDTRKKKGKRKKFFSKTCGPVGSSKVPVLTDSMMETRSMKHLGCLFRGRGV